MKYSDIKLDIFSEITARMGYGLAIRRELKPLIEGGADIKLIPDQDYLPSHMKIEDSYWDKLIKDSETKADNDIRICYCLPPRSKFSDKNKHRIIRSMWETDKYPREWVAHINRTASIFFAGCDALKASAINGGITIPVIPTYHTLDIDEWSKDGPTLEINEIPDGCIKFLFIGNFIARKNLEQLLLGFSVAFEGVQDVALVVKTWAHTNDANGKKHVAEAIKHFYNKATGLSSKPKVSIITDILEESQIIALIRSCDAYVSVSRGEGFDLPLMQAMAMERLVIATDFLAHKDYMTDSNSIKVKYTLTPCVDAAAPLYDSYQNWSAPDMGDFITKLKHSYELIKGGKHLTYGANARATIKNKYSPEVNSDRIANVIREIRDGKYAQKKVSIKDALKEILI